jgi:cell division protein FtsN
MGNASGGGGNGKLLLGAFIGLVIGVLMAFGLVLYLHKADLPFHDKTAKPEQNPDTIQPQSSLPLPPKPGDKPEEKPRFEFYKILPGVQDATPDTTPSPAPDPGQGQSLPPPAPIDQFYLQVGAFQKAADADNLKAKLALMGVEASVQDIAIPDKGTLHRVRTGPYASPSEMNQIRTLMAQNGVQATVIKIKDAGNLSIPAESKSPAKQ